MPEYSSHITQYKTLAIVLMGLLLCTLITIVVTSLDLVVWNVMIALTIACVKGFFVLTYFMHLKYESLILKFFVVMVFLLFAVVLVITFADYANR